MDKGSGGGMEDNNTFPKFQWSMFVNGKDEQVVVRGDYYQQFILDVEAVKKQFTTVVTERKIAEESVNTEAEMGSPDYEEEYFVREVKKESPNKGKHFKIGKTSGKFMGFTTEELT